MKNQNQNGIIKDITFIYNFLSNKRKKDLIFVIFTTILGGFSEIFSVVSALPFLLVLTSPNKAFESSYVRFFIDIFGLSDNDNLILPITLIFLAGIIISSCIRLYNLWLSIYLSADIGSELSCEAYKRTISQPYSIQINNNTSEIIATITAQVQSTIFAICNFLQLITSIFISICLIYSLIIVSWKVAISLSIAFISGYIFLGKATNQKLQNNSIIVSSATKNQYKELREGFGSIKNILLDRSQNFLVDSYKITDKLVRQKTANSQFLAAFPRYIFESFGLCIMTILVLTLSIFNKNGTNIIPLIGSFTLGAQKILPSLQLIFSSWAGIKARVGDMNSVINLLSQEMPKSLIYKKNYKPINSFDEIIFENIYFRYQNSRKDILRNLNLKIKKGEKIGIFGDSGSGKSTFLNILMGLEKPTQGNLYLNGKNLFDKSNIGLLGRWQSSISFVPQEIFIRDKSISENIAYNTNPNLIIKSRIIEAANKAKISNFIESFPLGYETIFGEDGKKLSGGQRQRIAIARAFYKRSKVLLMDESTSALDIKTQKNVLDTIKKLDENITVIMISHSKEVMSYMDRCIDFSNI
tara:strand:- start:12570 stop:14318 length:1749 start_codon:yes stop_codon:yes gene_type:complete